MAGKYLKPNIFEPYQCATPAFISLLERVVPPNYLMEVAAVALLLTIAEVRLLYGMLFQMAVSTLTVDSALHSTVRIVPSALK